MMDIIRLTIMIIIRNLMIINNNTDIIQMRPLTTCLVKPQINNKYLADLILEGFREK